MCCVFWGLQQDIITVKRLNNPPVLIKLIMDCVLILFRLPVDSPAVEQHADGQLGWSPSWRCTMGFLMNDITLLDRLTSFPKVRCCIVMFKQALTPKDPEWTIISADDLKRRLGVVPTQDEINAETCELLLPYLKMPEFNFESARRVSGNIAGLCVWVRSMVEYHEVARHVLPKFERLRMLTQELHQAQQLLQLAEVELRQKVILRYRLRTQFYDW